MVTHFHASVTDRGRTILGAGLPLRRMRCRMTISVIREISVKAPDNDCDSDGHGWYGQAKASGVVAS
jgi:hypothetical protein